MDTPTTRSERDALFTLMHDETATDTARREARDALIVACLPIVDYAVSRFRYYSDLDADDLHQTGCVALIQAIDKATSHYYAYATRRVTGAIASAVSKSTVNASIDKDTLRRARKITDEVYRHTEATGFPEAVELVGKAHGLTREQVTDALIVTANPSSLDAPRPDGQTPATLLRDPDPTPEDTFIAAEDSTRTLALLDTLPPMEREVVARSIGLHPGGMKTGEIADSLDAEPRAVSVALRVGMARLRHPSRVARLTEHAT